MARAMKDSGVEWIGEMPEDWNTVRFKFLHNGMNTGEAIDKEYWTMEEKDAIFYTAGVEPIRTNYRDFPAWKHTAENDILLARNGTPYVYIPKKGACYTDHIIRASMKEDINRQFVQYALQHSIASIVVDSVSLPTWSASLWNEQGLPWPSVLEQRRIADYLNRKCAEIDRIVAETERTIEEYKALKQSVITEAVTKGVRGPRPMKPSGIEWIGDIPQEWKMGKTKYYTSKIGSGKTPKGGAEVYTHSGILFLRSQNIYDEGLNLDNPTYITSEVDNDMANTRVQAEDVLLNITGGSIGRACVMPEEALPANVNQHVSIIRVKKDLVLPKLMHYFWISGLGKKAIALYQTGGNREGMSADAIANTPFMYYGLSEQEEIIGFLDCRTAEIDKLIARKQQLLAELAAYKKSLIYEYVTGKKEVPAV